MKLGYQTITWGGVVGQAQGVTSIKDLFYQTYGSTAKACQDIAAAGYTGIEIFDGNLAEYANDPDSFKNLLSQHELELVSVYTGANFIYNDILVDEFHKIKQAISFAKSMGAINIIVGGGAKRSTGTTEEDYRMLAKGLDQVTDLAAAAGLTACYHPHLTTIVETTAELDKIMGLSKIHFCPDTAHLTAGGVDAAAAIRKYGNRVRHVHLKDYTANPFAFLPLGKGEIDFANIFSALKEVSYDGWLVVELDGYDGDPKEAADISMKFIKENLK
ncbi:sugar phosphate isomerase/epimerase family protein [Candidatus Planktophila dulcis]|jgi:inosose dehydratase|uniref:sugar phosphate isomerase/epimerase family protein n=1 Tax=Candidatus Planktophila dulcis TaxID=1884914 RepID=UPI003CF64C50|nr:TIM barrel protein [Actinomycetota bacterium]